jgi:hypothetical protein
MKAKLLCEMLSVFVDHEVLGDATYNRAFTQHSIHRPVKRTDLHAVSMSVLVLHHFILPFSKV